MPQTPPQKLRLPSCCSTCCCCADVDATVVDDSAEDGVVDHAVVACHVDDDDYVDGDDVLYRVVVDAEIYHQLPTTTTMTRTRTMKMT